MLSNWVTSGLLYPAATRTNVVLAADHPASLTPSVWPHDTTIFRVKRGVDLSTGAAVALKLIDRARLASRPTAAEHVEREVEAMQRLDGHPNVARLLDVHWDVPYPSSDGSRVKREVVLLVIELAAGGELFDYMMYTGCFPETIARTYFRQLIAGLAHCHAAGVAHRDLKPENLLLSADFQLCIADFGLTAFSEDESGNPRALKTRVGSPGFMAPEVLAGGRDGYLGPPADVWSAGCILFILLAGFPPFNTAAAPDWWFNAVLHRRYDLFWEAHTRNALFSPAVQSLLNKIFVVEPAERATVDDIVADAWFNGMCTPPDTLGAELTRRKVRVDQRRLAKQRREAEEKGRAHKRGEESSPIGTDTGMTDDTSPAAVREDVLLGAEIASGHSGEAAGGAGAPRVEVEAFPPHVYRSLSGSEAAAPLLPPDFDASREFTAIWSSVDVTSLADRVCQALGTMSAEYTLNEAIYKFRATVTDPRGIVKMNVRIFQAPGGHHVVLASRRLGSVILFHVAFERFGKLLSDVSELPPLTGKTSDADATDASS